MKNINMLFFMNFLCIHHINLLSKLKFWRLSHFKLHMLTHKILLKWLNCLLLDADDQGLLSYHRLNKRLREKIDNVFRRERVSLTYKENRNKTNQIFFVLAHRITSVSCREIVNKRFVKKLKLKSRNIELFNNSFS